jgi:hypothetical protein
MKGKKVSFPKWLKIAEELTKKGIKWHEHYLFPKCIFNKSKKYIAILENEETGEIFISESLRHKPKDLKKLEKLVFKSVHVFKKKRMKKKK